MIFLREMYAELRAESHQAHRHTYDTPQKPRSAEHKPESRAPMAVRQLMSLCQWAPHWTFVSLERSIYRTATTIEYDLKHENDHRTTDHFHSDIELSGLAI